MESKLTKYTKELKVQKWTELVMNCNSSGMSKAEWCRENNINLMVLPILGDIELNKLSTSDIQRMIDKLKEQNYSYSSVKKAFEAVRSCLKFAVFENKIIKNPADFVELFHNEFENKENIKFWNDDEVEVFKKEALSRKPSGEYVYRLGMAFILLLSTGMRVGEALALK